MADRSQPACLIGLISGTSIDGIDAALVSFGDATVVHDARTLPFDTQLADALKLALADPHSLRIADFGRLHQQLGAAFAHAARALLRDNPEHAVDAIASHGQTLFHEPRAAAPFTLQAGDPATIATLTGLPVIADFRSADIAAGGEGAPLAPLFHEAALARPGERLAVVNLGGIANLTIIRPGQPTLGFDTGPANGLMNLWCQRHWGQPFDTNGAIAASGDVDSKLLAQLRRDPYFALPYPKSTGREHFNAAWLETQLRACGIGEASQQQAHRVAIMSTLCELTAVTVAEAIMQFQQNLDAILVCGGGAHNAELMRRLAKHSQAAVESTARRGVHPDHVEAALIAWLGWQRLRGEPVDTRSITGARQRIFSGSVSLPPVRESHD